MLTFCKFGTIMLIVKVIPIWVDSSNIHVLLLVLWWLCRLRTYAKNICESEVCSCDYIGRIVCECGLERQDKINVSRSGVTRLPVHTSSFQVKDCDQVFIESKCFEHLKALTRIHLINVKKLILERHSFSWNDSTIHDSYPNRGIEIKVENTSVPNLPSYVFRGHIETIIFEQSHLYVIRSYAFSSLAGTKVILFKRCKFFLMESQAFKKFSVDNVFSITNSHFATAIPSRAITDVAVRNEFLLEGVIFHDRIRSSAIRIHGCRKFQLRNSYLAHVEGEAFMVHSNGPVFIDDNVFGILETGAVLGFSVEKRELELSGRQEFVFENNTIEKTEKASLLFDADCFEPRLDWIFLNTKCECASLSTWISDLIVYTTGRGSYALRTVPASADVKLNEIISCQNDRRSKYVRLKDYSEGQCSSKTQSLQIVAFVGLIMVLVLLIVLLFYWLRYRCGDRKAHHWITVPKTQPLQVQPSNTSVVGDSSGRRRSQPPIPDYEQPSSTRLIIPRPKPRSTVCFAQDTKYAEIGPAKTRVVVEGRTELVPNVNSFNERAHIYSNQFIELDYNHSSRRSSSNTHQLLISDL